MAFKRIAVAFAFISAALCALTLFSTKFLAVDRPDYVSTPSRAVALGINNESDLVGVRPTSGPNFIFQVRDDLSWHILFSVSVDDADRAFANLPPITVFMPKDAYNCGLGLHDTEETRLFYEKIDISPENVVYRVRPLPFDNKTTGKHLAIYALMCDSRSLRTGSAGIATDYFEIQYTPGLASQYGLVPGLGENLKRLNFSYGAHTQNSNWSNHDDVATYFDRLSFAGSKGDNIVTWPNQQVDDSFDVSGVVGETWMEKIQTYSDYIITTTLGMLVTAVITATISTKKATNEKRP